MKVISFVLRHVEIFLIAGLILLAAVQYLLRPQSQTLAQIGESKVLRVLIADEPDSQFILNHQHYGFEYELLSAFARELGAEMELDVVPYGELFTLLAAGEGDIAVGGILDSNFVRRVSTPSIPWFQAKTTIVYKRGTKRPLSLEDFTGSNILASARYFDLVEFEDFDLIDDHRSEYELLTAVNEGTERYVLSTDYRAKNAKHYLPNLNRSFILPQKLGVVWALPKRVDPAFESRLNDFLSKAVDENLPSYFADTYFKNAKRLNTYDAIAIHKRIETILPKFEYAFKRAARKGGIDWYLLAAMAYQESHWSNSAQSPTGVRGIMQLTQETAQFLGVDDRMDMSQSIDAAARYIKFLGSRLPKSIKEPDRTWFAVAAYNMGLKHVLAAYRRARSEGKDPRLWREVSPLLPNLYGAPFSQGVQASHYVERVQIFTDILRFYDIHQRRETTIEPSILTSQLQSVSEPVPQ